MAEHIHRYQPIAELLGAQGYKVIAHDHRGHGQSIASPEDEGHYADEDGWSKTVEDIFTVHSYVRDQCGPDTQIILLGHSMGSFIATQFARVHGDTLTALVLSGSNLAQPGLMSAAKLVAKIERWRQGPRGKSAFIDKLSFGAFNKNFQPARTDFDWLSREPKEVDLYVADPLCGFLCSNQLWIDMLSGLIALGQKDAFSSIPSSLPIYLFSGSLDPVSADTNGVDGLFKRLEETGHSNVSMKLYEQGRHEMLNETNRDEVVGDLVVWLKNVGA
jgi:alpha-beta hydrolase superfamily lysophospholipase